MTLLPIKKEITVGQIVFAVVFILGAAITWGSTVNRVESTEKSLKDHLDGVEMTKREYVRREELTAELRAVHQELTDLKTLAYSYFTKTQLSPEELQRIKGSINGR